MGPIASGLPRDLVDRLVEAERAPIKQIEDRKKNEEAKLKLVQDLNSKVGDISAGIKELTKFRNFRDLKGTAGRPELIDLTVDKNTAEPGDYQVEIMQMAGKSSMMSNGFSDSDDTSVGAGYFSYSLPNGEEKEVYIDPDNSTLKGIAQTINKQRDLDLNAIVIDDGSGSDTPWRLIISHKKSGETNDAEFPNFYFLDGDEEFYMDEERAAQNSKIKINGFEVEFEGNRVTSLLPGVTIDIKEAAPGKEFTIKVEEDLKSIREKVKGMVDKINQVLTFIQSQNKLDKDSNTRNTLGGDVTLQTLEYKIRQLVLNPMDTEYGSIRMADMGVQFARAGTLDFNGDKFEKTLAANFEAVAHFFTGTEDISDGFAVQLDDLVKGMTRQDGVVNSRIEGIRSRIKDLDRQIENKERQVATTTQNLKDKFAKLEGTVAKIKSQGASFANGGGGGLLG